MTMNTYGVIGGGILLLLAIIGAFFKIRGDGKKAAENAMLRDRLEAKQTSERIEDEVARAPADKNREELSKWGM